MAGISESGDQLRLGQLTGSRRVLENAFASQFIRLAVRSGQAHWRGWVTERRNILKDFRQLHGCEPDSIDMARNRVLFQIGLSMVEFLRNYGTEGACRTAPLPYRPATMAEIDA
jgi:hypothetical protein